MRILILYAHPVETSFHSALHATAVEILTAAGHQVDDLDLYGEAFEPRLSRAERLGYHDTETNQAPVAGYVARLKAAEALLLMTPVWNFGFPAILSGFFDRVFLPGVSFHLVDGEVRPGLQHIKRIAAVTSYGATWSNALLMGNPPRKYVTRMLRVLIKPGAAVKYLALYNMNKATDLQRQRFHDKVARYCRDWPMDAV